MSANSQGLDQKIDTLAKDITELKQSVSEHREEFRSALAENREEFQGALAENRAEFKNEMSLLREELKSYVGVLAEETNHKLDIIIEGLIGLREWCEREIRDIRKELEQIHMILFRKADLERVEILERRVDHLEKALSEMG